MIDQPKIDYAEWARKEAAREINDLIDRLDELRDHGEQPPYEVIDTIQHMKRVLRGLYYDRRTPVE